MPIKDKSKYPANWKELREQRLAMANNRCEFCGVENHSVVERVWKDGSRHSTRIVLTTAHLDRNPANGDINNLRMLCQKCHLEYDADQHRESRKNSQKKDKPLSEGEKYMLNDLSAALHDESARIDRIIAKGECPKELMDYFWKFWNQLFNKTE